MKEKDAEAIGLDNEIEWMKYTRELIPKLSEILMIPENNLNYLAAFHEKHPSQQNSKSDAGLQPHVHLIIWEQEPLKERPVIHESLFKEMRQIIKEHFLTTVANKGLVHNELVVESSHDISLDTEIEESLLTNEPDKELPVEVINSMSSNPLLLLERYHKEIVEMASKHLNQEIAFDLQKTDRLQHFLASGGISNKEVDEYKMYQQKDVLELAIKLASLPPSIDIHSLELLNKTIDKMESIVNSPINKEGNISKELAIKPSGELIKTQPQLTIKKAKAILPILYDIKENLDIRIANIPCLPLYKEGEKAIRILESNPIIVDQKIGDLKKDIQATIEKQYLPLLVDTANSLKENHIISTSNELKEERQQKTIPFDFIHPLSLDKSILEHINSISQSINSASFDACSSIAYYLNDNYFKHHFKECERHILQQASEIEIILYVRNLIKELDQRHQAKELDL